MISIETYTSKTLSSVLKFFWCLKVSEDIEAPYVEEILPDGHPEIIFHLNSTPARKRTGSEEWHNDPPAFFAGQNKKSYVQQLNPGAMIYGVRFYPHTQALFYDFPACLATDNLISLPDVSAKDTLTDCITGSPQQTFENLEKEFVRRATRLQNPGNTFLYVDAALKKIFSQKGNVRMEVLEKITGVSSRHLEKSFLKYVGVSPKQFCTTLRYSHFVTYRKNNPGKTLTECAYEAEFHDQAHLIRLSHMITGRSPKAYFTNQNYINTFFFEP
jgi:AraC-like DNA-binding protein